jgi:CBS domain-containing protein
MIVLEVCNREVITLEQDENLIEAAKLMRQHHIGDVVVVKMKDNRRIPVGIITDRDIVIEVVATELDPNVITVGDIMPQNLLVVKEDTDIYQAIQLMANKGVRRLPVVNNKAELVGILSLDDLLGLTANFIGNFAKLVNKEKKNESKNRR